MYSVLTTAPISLHVQIARQIARRILSGDLPQESKLPNEKKLCEQLSISRTALREALKLLISKGLLLSKPKIGTTVTDKNNWNFFDPQLLEWIDGLENSNLFYQQFLSLRKAIEPEACALAAKNASAQQRIELTDTFYRMEKIANNFDRDLWIEADMYFHRLIFLSTGNPFYLPFGNVLATIFRSFINYSSKDGNACIKEHSAIYAAIMAGNEDQAREASRCLLVTEKHSLPSQCHDRLIPLMQ